MVQEPLLGGEDCEEKGYLDLLERTGLFGLNLMPKLQAKERGGEEKEAFTLKGP